MAFEFTDDTSFEAHKGSDAGPKRRGGRPKKPKVEPAPAPEPGGANVGTAPDPAAEVIPKKAGLPRTGRYKPRPYRPERWGKGKKYAASGEWVPRFLKAYAKTGNIGHAAYIAGVARQTVANWKDRDPEFAGQVADALEWHKAQFDDEARRRAMEGDEIVVWDKAKGEWVAIRQKNPLYFFFYGKRIIPEYRDSYKPEDEGQGRANQQIIVQYLMDGARAPAAETAAIPTFDEFKAIEVESRAESKDERRTRLLAELARLEAEGSDEPDVPVPAPDGD